MTLLLRLKTTKPKPDNGWQQQQNNLLLQNLTTLPKLVQTTTKDSGAKIGSDTLKTTIGGDGGGDGGIGLDVIRGSLNQMKSTTNQTPVTPRWKPNISPVNGGTSLLPDWMFGKEIRDRLENVNDSGNFGTVRLYIHGESGEKRKTLRPQVK